jgi:hypothetical protein
VVKQLSFEAPKHVAQPLIQMVTDELRGICDARSPSTAGLGFRV